MLTVPIYFQVTARASVTAAGAHLIPAVCGNAIGGLIRGVYIIRCSTSPQEAQINLIINRTASYKSLAIFGQVSASICYLLLILTWSGHTNVWESLHIAHGGYGMGVAMSTTFVCLAAGVEESEMAIASTGLYLSSNIGALIGSSMASSVVQTSLRKKLDQCFKDFSDREKASFFGPSSLCKFAFYRSEVTKVDHADHSTNTIV